MVNTIRPEPLSTQCSNTNRDDWWTSPCCYEDMGDVGEGVHACPKCGRDVRCSLEYVPQCMAELAEGDD